MKEPLGIVQVGAFCPVGLDARQAAASMRAGIPRKTESPIMDGQLEPIVLGHLPDEVLPPLVPALADLRAGLTTLQMRLLRLATPALHEVLGVEPAKEGEPDRKDPRGRSTVLPPGLGSLPPLLLVAPASASQPLVVPSLLGQLARQTGAPVDVAASRLFAIGHAGLFSAVEYARTQLFEPGKAELAVVGGVDSYLDLQRLSELDADGRLPTDLPKDAFTPGEGAAFVLIAPRSTCRRFGLEPLAWISAVGLGTEAGHRRSTEPFRGDGLALAFARALAGRDQEPAEPMRAVMAGFTGESCHAKEWGVALLRHAECFAQALRVEHPAEYTGDMGAALAPMMLAITALGLRRGHIVGPVLVWASSDGPERGALVVRAAT
jgi:3-oxoacyl-[acyl-carrier-protein] synthase-1